jgi:hypothetical protein
VPPRDLYHDAVKQALVKDGWTITDDPFKMKFGAFRLYADLGAEKMVAAEKAGRRIVVEIKVFTGPSRIADLQQAVGQYGVYHSALKRMSPPRELFLAVSREVHEEFFREAPIQAVVADYEIKLLVFDPDQREVVQWINEASTDRS